MIGYRRDEAMDVLGFGVRPSTRPRPGSATRLTLFRKIRESKHTKASVRRPARAPAALPFGPMSDSTPRLTLADLRFLADRSPEPIGIHSGGILLHSNERLARMLRVENAASLEGRALMNFVAPAERASLARRLETHSNVDEVATAFETRMSCADGAIIDVETLSTRLEIDGRSVVMSSIRDISARKRSERLLRDQAAAFEAAQRFASFGMWTEDPESGRGPEWSAETFRIFGVDPEGFTYSRERLLSIIHPDDVESVVEARQMLLAGGDRYEFEYRVVHPDGEVRWVRALGGTELAPDGSRRLIGVAQDVTDRRAVEAQLTRSQKMEAIGRLAGGIAHDFNNLLMVMMGQVAIAQRRLGHPELVGDALRELDLAIERAASLTQQLLAFARRQVTRPEVVDFASVLREIEPLIARMIREDIALDLAIDSAPAWVRADRSQLEQVVFNLAVNARDAMPDGGRLAIRLVEERRNDAPSSAVLEVRDEGSGIPPEIVDRIFDPFFTTKMPGHGTGLGLSTVYAIVEQANGRIEVERGPDGRGSVFRIHWPSAAAPRASGAAPREPKREAPVARGEVLLVEDDAQVRRVISLSLSELGFSVHMAENSEQALDLLRGPARAIDALVTDVVMPGVSGAVLARLAREIVPDLDVLLMSGYAANHVDQELLRDPRVRFLRKPVSMAELSRTLDEMLRAT